MFCMVLFCSYLFWRDQFSERAEQLLIEELKKLQNMGIIYLIEFPIYRKYNRCSDTAGEYNCTPGECAWEVFSQNGRKTSDASTKNGEIQSSI